MRELRVNQDFRFLGVYASHENQDQETLWEVYDSTVYKGLAHACLFSLVHSQKLQLCMQSE